jgi:hypothetical protein
VAKEMSMRDMLETAFDASEEDDEDVIQGELDFGDEEAGEEIDEHSESAEVEEPEAEEDDVEELTEDDVAPEPEPEPDNKAPASWTPEAREAWKKIPPNARAEIQRRENELGRVFRETAQDRQFVDQYLNLMEPYMPMLRSSGIAPLEAVGRFMNTAQVLQSGTTAQKAQMVSSIINDYKVDLQTLDTVLAGMPVPQQAQQLAPDAMIQQQLAPVYSFMQEVQRGRQQVAQRTAQQQQAEIQAFAKDKEFFQDLAPIMADFMDVAASRGQEMDLNVAYGMALNSRPDIQKVMQQRAAAGNAAGNKRKLGRKRRAASSVRDSSTGPRGSSGKTRSLRDDILGAMEDAED